MPVEITIFDFKCFNQLRNGDDFSQNTGDFTPNLVGNIGEKVLLEYNINIGQTAFAEKDLEEWFIEADPTILEIVRDSGSFLDDRIQVGDKYRLYTDWEKRKTTLPEYTGIVEFISGDGRTLKYSIDSGTDVATGNYTNIGLVFDQLNDIDNRNTAVFLRFGLLENDETFNFISKTTENQQVYYVGGLGITPPVAAESLGTIKDWVSGDVTVQIQNTAPDQGQAQYTVRHSFIINPFYILSYRSFIDAGTIPTLLEGDNALKYAIQVEFRKTLTNTGSSKIGTLDDLKGSTGWYSENFNGLNPDYEIVSVAYEDDATADPLDGVNINLATKATITVSKKSGAITDYSVGVYIVRVPTSETDYIGTQTNLVDNYILKSEIVTSPATSTPNLATSLSGGDLILEYTIDYTTAEKLRLSTSDEFLLLVQVEDPTIVDPGNSDRLMMIADLRNYVDIDFLSEFINVVNYGFLRYGQALGDTINTSPETSNEDGIILETTFGSNFVRNCVINSIQVRLLAFDGSNSFNLDLYDFQIGAPVFVGGFQQIEVNTSRGYQLPDGNDFNVVRITTESQVGDYQQYKLSIGQKIRWQDWIFNPQVDNAFFDASKPNNNQNLKSSNYSNEQSYEIYLALVVNVSGEDDLGRTITGDFINYGGVISVNDYDESTDAPAITGVIETYDPDTNQSLSGNILYNGKDTLFRAVFQNAALMDFGIHRIEPSQNPGDGIDELTSLYGPRPTNLLKPKTGETQLSFDKVGSVVTTECLVDGSKIQEGVNYKLSARIAQIPLNLVDPFTFTIETSNPGTTGADQFQLPFEATGNYNCFVDKGNGDPLVNITSGLAPETLLDYSGTGAGQYEVKIYGTFEGWRFGNSGDRQKMLDVSEWGTLVITSDAAFYGCTNLTVSAADNLTFSGIGSLNQMFRACTSITTIPTLTAWDLTGVTNFDQMFYDCVLFNQVLTDLDIDEAVTMREMFFNCDSLNSAILWGSKTSNVTDMFGLFRGCAIFNQNISGWDVSSVQNLSGTFADTGAFNQNISAWTTTSVNNMFETFQNADSFNQNIEAWDVSNVTTFENCFSGCAIYNQPLSGWDMSSATTLRRMFENCAAFNSALLWGSTTSNVVDIVGMFDGCPVFNQNITGWDMSSLDNMFETFKDTGAFNQNIGLWTTPVLRVMSSTFRNAAAFNQPIGTLDVSNVVSFESCFQNSVFNQSLSGWDVSSCTNMRSMFQSNTVFNSALLWGSTVQNVQEFNNMFNGATAFNQNISGWNVSGAQQFSRTFFGATSFNQNISGWNISACFSLFEMFNGATAFNQDLSGWDISAVINADKMFNGTSFSQSNYDALLNINTGWPASSPQNNVPFGASGTNYTLADADAVAGRADLIGVHNWTITDAGGV